jgi:hypothetical protein
MVLLRRWWFEVSGHPTKLGSVVGRASRHVHGRASRAQLQRDALPDTAGRSGDDGDHAYERRRRGH